jgi:hypothetical protein
MDEQNVQFQRAFLWDQIMEFGSIRQDEDRPETDRLAKLAAVWSEFAGLEHHTGNDDAARSYCQTAIGIWKRLIQENPGAVEYRRQCASVCHNLGLLQVEIDDIEQAQSSFEKAVEILKELVIEQPDVPEHSHELAGSINNLGLIAEHTGDNATAKENFSKTAETWEQLARENPKADEYQKSFVTSRMNLKRFERVLRGRRRSRQSRRVGVGLIATSILLVFGWWGVAAIVGPAGPNRNAWAYHLGGWMLLLAFVCLVVGGIVYFWAITSPYSQR